MNRKTVTSILLLFLLMAMSSCSNTFNMLLKCEDSDFKYEAAKQYFAEGKYTRASSLLQDVVNITKGTDKGEENLYMLGMSEYCLKDYEASSEYFKKYTSSYPKGIFVENAYYYYAQSLYMSTPEVALDQSDTYSAIKAFQQYIDLFPETALKESAQQKLFVLQDKLVQKEYLAAKLYYDLGPYFGNCSASNENNYESCIITSQNALRDYPYTSLRESFSLLIMKSKYALAEQSVEEKKLERYRDAEDECYGFLNEYPDSKDKDVALRYIANCKKYIKD